MDETAVTVAAVRDCGPDAVAVEFESPVGFQANPGQFVKLTATIQEEEISRFYTISSADVRETFETTISYDPAEGGAFSEYLLGIDAGDTVRLSGPFGNDYYEGESRVVVLAGGPGIGPAIGIAERARSEGGEAAVVYHDDQPLHEDRLNKLTREGADVLILSENDSFESAVGDRITGSAAEQLFVYGFAEFLELAESAVETTEADFDEAKVENFG
jgi:cytochrome-b5 reductase